MDRRPCPSDRGACLIWVFLQDMESIEFETIWCEHLSNLKLPKADLKTYRKSIAVYYGDLRLIVIKVSSVLSSLESIAYEGWQF